MHNVDRNGSRRYTGEDVVLRIPENRCPHCGGPRHPRERFQARPEESPESFALALVVCAVLFGSLYLLAIILPIAVSPGV